MSDLDAGIQTHTHLTGFLYHVPSVREETGGDFESVPVRFEVDEEERLTMEFIYSGEGETYFIPLELLKAALELHRQAIES